MYGITLDNQKLVATAIQFACNWDKAITNDQRSTLRRIAYAIASPGEMQDSHKLFKLHTKNDAFYHEYTLEEAVQFAWIASHRERARVALSRLEVGGTILDSDRDLWERVR